VLVWVVSRRIDEQRVPLRIERELVTLLVAIAVRAGKQVVQPVKRPGHVSRDGLEMVDVGTEVIAAVHATLDPGRHLGKVAPQSVSLRPRRSPRRAGCRDVRVARLKACGENVKAEAQLGVECHSGDGDHWSCLMWAAISLTRVLVELVSKSVIRRYSSFSSREAVPLNTFSSSATSCWRRRLALSE
jgi:hypothetical protein